MTEPFDLRSHIFDKDGNLVKAQPYRLHCKGQTKLYERPPGSGLMYYENGELAEESKAKLAQMEAAKEAQAKEAEAELFAKVEAEAKKLAAEQAEKEANLAEAAKNKLKELKNVAKQ